MTELSISMAPWRSSTRYYASQGVAARPVEKVAGATRGRLGRRDRASRRPGVQRALDAQIRRSRHRLRLGLDAGARPRPPARRRTAAGHLRPCRLGRAWRHDSRDRRAAKSGSRMARARRSSHLARGRRASPREPLHLHRAMARSDDGDGRRPKRRRGREALSPNCSTGSASSPRRNGKLRLMVDYLRNDARPGTGAAPWPR